MKLMTQVLALSLVGILLTTGCGIQKKDAKVFPKGTTVFGIDVSKKDYDEVLKIAQEEYPKYVPDTIPVKVGENEFKIKVQDLAYYMEPMGVTLEDFRENPDSDIQNPGNYTANWFLIIPPSSLANVISEEGKKYNLEFNEKLITYCNFITPDELFTKGVDLKTDCLGPMDLEKVLHQQ